MITRSNSRATGILLALVTLVAEGSSPEQQLPLSTPTTQPTTLPTRPLYVGQKKDEWSSYQDMHAYILDRFVRSEGFGVYRQSAEDNRPRFRLVYADGERFRVGKVELISLNDGKQPFAYVLQFADASKKQSAGAKHVPVDETTAGTLRELKEGKEVVMTQEDDRHEFVGAIRATSACLKCHAVPEGTLLGAFRYPLVPESGFQK